jgi:hypothetical protein
MGTVEKVFLGFTAVAVVGTIFTSSYSAGILGQLFGGVAKVYTSVKH